MRCHGGFEGHCFERVRDSAVHVQFGGHAGGEAAPSVVDGFVPEDVQLDDLHVERGQVDQIGRPGRRRVGRHVVTAVGRAEVRLPHGDVVAVRPAVHAGQRVIRLDGAIVQRRVHQDLPRDGRSAPVTGQQRQRGGHGPAGAVTHDGDASGVDTEFAGVLGKPRQLRSSVLQ
jgi:hypothetical protein